MSRAYNREKMIRLIEDNLSNLPIMTDNLKDILIAFDNVISAVPKDKIPHTMIGLSQIPPIYDAPCEVRPSTYGRGVFATRDINEGDYITLYPAHGVSFDRTTKSESFYIGNIEYDAKYTVSHDTNELEFVGDKNRFNRVFMGHLLNDSYPDVEEFKDKEKLGATVVKYLLHTITFSNCQFKDGKNFVIIQAIKNIKKDEELLISYGSGYWGDDENEKVSETVVAFTKYIESIWITDRKKAKFISDLIQADVEKHRHIDSL